MGTDSSGQATSVASPRTAGSGSVGPLRLVALVAVVAGAVGSVVSLLLVSHRSDSRIVLVLIAGWVLSPFVALVFANTLAKRWSALTRTTLHCMMLILTVGSLAAYWSVVLKPPTSKRAFMFVAVPLASWGLIAVVIPLAALISGRLSRRGGSPT
jgi:hypothetical protein